MLTRVQINIREAVPADRQRLANLIHFEIHVHRHLDWRAPLDWIGNEPYLLAEKGKEIAAALACPPDPPYVAWIRLFAVASTIAPEQAWEALWPVALEHLKGIPGMGQVATIPLQQWYADLLRTSRFEQTHRVVMLGWEQRRWTPQVEPPACLIRPMTLDDLGQVEAVDHAAFEPLWHNSRLSLELAFRQAAVATVAEVDSHLVGYQISTATPMGGHLARLAVDPKFQGRRIGYSLVQDMLSQFSRRGAHMVTVNTQQDNHASLRLYEKTGFRRTGEEYPVYRFPLD